MQLHGPFAFVFMGLIAWSGYVLPLSAAATVMPPAIIRTGHSTQYGAEREDFLVGPGRNPAFVVLPRRPSEDGSRPWIWYAPTFVQAGGGLPDPSHEWMFEQWLSNGFAICGVDVGESYGNPAGRAVFTQFYEAVRQQYGLSPRACLLPQSRGGLMLYNWAAEYPDRVECIGGIYTVCDQASWPGLATSSPAYGWSEAELANHLTEHNPIDRLAPLAKAGVPILHLHGDADTVVPLERNSGELARRYHSLGGEMTLVIVHGKGHEVCPEFFHNPQLVEFFLRHGRAAAVVGMVGSTAALDSEWLLRQFAAPPRSAGPWVYWFWLNGNITKEGITADLEAMKEVGLAGALWMWGGQVGGDVKGSVKFLSPSWWDLMRHTVREADRLGLKINLSNGSGWSHSGGPWIRPSESMQRLDMSQEVRWEGPGRKEMTLSRDALIGVVGYRLNESGTNRLLADAIKAAGSSTQSGIAITNAVKSGSSVILTDKVDASGRLIWDVPEGTWSVRMFHYNSTGDRPHPIAVDEGGLECDKLSPAAVEQNWKGFVLRVLEECGPEARRVIRWTHADSYEFGAQTWTPGLRELFRSRCGYDPLPYLPTLLGQVVDSPEMTARFLWDFQRIRADLFVEAVGGHFRDLCEREGVTLTTEPHLVPEVFDQIQYGGHVAEPVGNFLAERRTHWYAANPPVGPEVHLAKGEASSAATYGLDGVVWAEAFTGVDHAHAWKESPAYLKTWGDLWFTEGINRFCIHCWAHSPSLTQRPGITLGPWGIHFDRRNTWFDLAMGYVAYLTRCQFLLQQGRTVADVCMLTGDGVTAEFPRHPELRAAGYDYHGLTAEVLRDARAVEGQIVLRSGMRYRLLATYSREMRPETIHKLYELVRAGASIMGIKPEVAPGLENYPSNGEEVRRMAEELWGSDAEASSTGHICGRGRVFRGTPEQPTPSTAGCGVAAYLSCAREIEVLRAMGVSPDFEYGASGKEDCDHILAYIHRSVAGMELYFVSNQAGQSRNETVIFRSTGRRPELWDAVTGETRDLPVFQEQNGRTIVPLTFAPGQSFFIVFRKTAGEETRNETRANFREAQTVVELTGPWQVTFDPQWGGPKTAVTFDALQDWAQRPEEAVGHYSGKATYRNTFEFSADWKGQPIYLDLGAVKDLAGVRLNGKRVGVVWCAPWRIAITDFVRPGSNELEIVVANQWVNRLIGDAGLPEDKRITWTTWNPYQTNSPLLPSGLLGPVRLQTSPQ